MLRSLPVLLALSGCVQTGSLAAGTRDGESFVFRPGVIVSPSTGTAYLAAPDGTLQAIDLVTGKALWSSKLGARPLLLSGTSLVAQAAPRAGDSALRIVVLDASRQGSKLFEGEVELPPPARPSLEEGPGVSFRIGASAHPDGAILRWSFGRKEESGEPPSPSPPDASHGTVRVDLKSRRIESGRGADEKTPDREPLPGSVARLVETGELTGPPWRVGDVLAGLTVRRGEKGSTTVLRRWKSPGGEALPDKPLFGPELAVRYASADGKHLLASGRSSQGPGYEWVVFSLRTGERVALVRDERPAAWFFLHGALIVSELRTERNPAIIATETEKGTIVWRHPFFDGRHRGSLPPASPPP